MSFTTPIYPGVDLEANEGPLLMAVSIAFISLTSCTIVIRLFSRRYTKIPFGLNNLLILIAAALSIAYTAIIIVEVQTKFYGQHIGKSDLEHLEALLESLYVLAIIYPVALSMSKLSLLALYWRVFAVTRGRIPILVASALNGAWCVAALIVGIFPCHPIPAFWDLTVIAQCIDYSIFSTSNEAFTILFDIVLLFIPAWFIAQIKRSTGERISSISTFLLGLVVTIVATIRLWRLVIVQKMPRLDPTYNETDAGLWAIIEVNLWILVASIPTFCPLLIKIWSHHAGRKAGSSTSSGTSSNFHLSQMGNMGTCFQKKPSDMDRDSKPVFGFGDAQGYQGSEEDIERLGRIRSSEARGSGDSGFEDGLGIRVVGVNPDSEMEIEGWRNSYGYACQRGNGDIGEKERWSNEMKDLAGIRVQKKKDVRRNAGIWI